MSFYQKITNTGIYNQKNRHYLKELKLLNSYIIILFHILLFIFCIDIYFITYVHPLEFYSHSISLFLMISILVLNKHGFFKVTRVIWIVFIFLLISFASFVIDFSIYSACFLGLVPLVVMSLYEKQIYAYICLGICIITFAIHMFYSTTSSDTILKLNDPIPYAFFFSLFFLFSYFKKLNLKNEKLLEIEKNKVLNDKMILENQQVELKKLNEFKSHFFINLSHEIRTPITLIQGYTSKIDFEKPEVFNKKQINVVNEQLGQVKSIVNTIMDLGKMDNDKLILNTKTISLHAFLNKCYANFKTHFDKKNISFSMRLSAKDFLINIDEHQMERCISNLLSNAHKFTNTGGKVVLFANYINDLEIGVFDDGIGIPENDIDKIFDRFYQSENHITKSQGSGIGLSFTKNIIEEHGFSISAKSIPNTETIFKIKIPEIYVSEHLQKEYKPLQPNVKGKILIVDDHEQMRNYLKSLLPNTNIIEAENGLQAQQIVENEKIDLIITDYMMPIMDGHKFVTNIKKLGYKTPVIVITARGDEEGKLNMLRLGIDTYLTKPFLEEEFMYSVNKSLQLHQNIVASEREASPEELKETNNDAESFHKTMLQIISKKYNMHNFGVDDLVVALNTSKRTLNRKTKLLLGQTPNQLIIEVRLQKALEIKETQPDISKRELAKMVGLSNADYLSKRLDIRFGKDKL